MKCPTCGSDPRYATALATLLVVLNGSSPQDWDRIIPIWLETALTDDMYKNLVTDIADSKYDAPSTES